METLNKSKNKPRRKKLLKIDTSTPLSFFRDALRVRAEILRHAEICANEGAMIQKGESITPHPSFDAIMRHLLSLRTAFVYLGASPQLSSFLMKVFVEGPGIVTHGKVGRSKC